LLGALEGPVSLQHTGLEISSESEDRD